MGQWWTYDTNVWGNVTLAVFEDHDDYWHLETDNPELAWNHVDDPISFLGMVNKENLAGSQEQEVRYFDFPLVEGKNWTTHWTGYDLLIEVKWINETAIHLHGYHPDGWHRLSYDYDPRVGWFTDMVVYGEDHEAIYEVYYVDHGDGFNGSIAKWDFDRKGVISESNQVGNNILSFNVAEGAGELYVDYSWECEGSDTEITQLVVLLHPTPATPENTHTVEDGCNDLDDVIIVEEPEAGSWTLRANFLSLTEPSTFSADVRVRTLEWINMVPTA